MAEQLKELLEKIQQEGVKVAEDKARLIDEEAKRQARAIIDEARKEAETLMLEAKDSISKTEEGMKATLRQTGRDIILALKAEINATLNKLITARVREALTIDELKNILSSLVHGVSAHDKSEIVLTLKKEDAEKLEKGLLGELKKTIQAGLTIKASDDIHAGFTISYDAGKSLFDFTDKALAEYIAQSLKPKLAEILK